MKQRLSYCLIWGILAIAGTQSVRAQSIPIELFVGNKNLQTTIVVAKPFMPESKFRILCISSFEAYKVSDKKNSSVMNTDVSFSLYKGFSLGAGITYNSVVGLSPTLGIGFEKFTKKHKITIAPAIVFGSNTSVRVILNHSHKFRLNDKLKLYMSSNNLLTYRFSGDHVRSYAKQRVGLDYNTFQFGVGVNFDWFGVTKQSSTNMGLFMRKEF